MSNIQCFLNKVVCDSRDKCTSDRYHCKTCLRNKANKYEDKFSISPGGYNPMEKWIQK